MRRGPYLAATLALAAASAATSIATAQASKPAGSPSAGPPTGGIVRQLGFPHDDSKEAGDARAFQHLKVSGRDVGKAVKKVRRLKWYSSLIPASRRAKQENKPIVWIQALGTLKGYT